MGVTTSSCYSDPFDMSVMTYCYIYFRRRSLIIMAVCKPFKRGGFATGKPLRPVKKWDFFPQISVGIELPTVKFLRSKRTYTGIQTCEAASSAPNVLPITRKTEIYRENKV